jgi:GlpG protein
MRMIGTIPDGDHAERFSDYLVTRDIDNMIEQTAAGDFGVWVEHDDHLDRAKGELLNFLRHPDDPQYRDVAKEAGKIRRAEEKKQKRLHGRFVDVRTSWGQARQWAAPVTIALIIGCFVVSLATGSVFYNPNHPDPASAAKIFKVLFLPYPPPTDTVGGMLRFWWGYVTQTGQAWRLLTPMFVHWNILHLVFNVFWLRDLGAMIETRRGSLRFLSLVLAVAILPFFVQYLWHGPIFGGMSGVNYGLFGYIWIKQRYEPQLGLGVSRETTWILFGWLLLCMTGLMGPVANAAHVAGLGVGAAAGFLPHQFRRLRRGR